MCFTHKRYLSRRTIDWYLGNWSQNTCALHNYPGSLKGLLSWILLSWQIFPTEPRLDGDKLRKLPSTSLLRLKLKPAPLAHRTQMKTVDMNRTKYEPYRFATAILYLIAGNIDAGKPHDLAGSFYKRTQSQAVAPSYALSLTILC